MAKKSAVNRNERVKVLVKLHAAKRVALKKIANNETLPLEDRFDARLKLAELPRNSSKTRIRNRCEVTGRPRGYYRKLRMSRISLRDLGSAGLIPGLVKSSWSGRFQMVNDPIGDLIARIKNAAARGRSKVLTPASKMRARLLDVLADEGYIRGYHLVERPGAFPEFEVELKYFDGAPVIVEIARISKPGRRVYSSIRDLKPVKNGLGISILSTPKGVMSDTAARDANVGGEVLCRVY